MNSISPVICPKCGHVRTANDNAPAWQCPACGIAYKKYQAYLKRAHQAVKPLRADEPAPKLVFDTSIWSLIAANVVALVAALVFDWTTKSLMLIYWSQSVIIGISYFLRILSLEKFSTENFTVNGRHVDPTTSTKIKTAFFFAVHYGMFHLVYYMFLVHDPLQPVVLDAAFWICTAAFAVNHFWSYRYNRDIDRKGTPNIGTLMSTPYIRILPMHFTFIVGSHFIDSGATLLLFGGLKTVADVGMHYMEHVQLQKELAQPSA